MMGWGAHNTLWLVFLWIWKAHPNCDIEMRLKICGPLRYAYTDTFGVAFACSSRFACIFVGGMSLSHRFSANEYSKQHKMDLNCPLNVCIPFCYKSYGAFLM